MNYIIGGILFVFSLFDVRTKRVPKVLFLVAGIVVLGMKLAMEREWNWYGYTGILVGVFLLFITIISGGKIGLGDAILFVILGLQLSLIENGILLLLALTFSSLVGGILWLAKRVKRQEAIPFIPFVFIGYEVILLCG